MEDTTTQAVHIVFNTNQEWEGEVFIDDDVRVVRIMKNEEETGFIPFEAIRCLMKL